MLKMVLADKQAIFRAGIAKVLGVEDEIRIVAQVQSSDQIPMASAERSCCWTSPGPIDSTVTEPWRVAGAAGVK